MSLRAFHLVFVTVSTLFCAFLVLWSFGLALEQSSMATALGYVGIAGLLLMPVYGVYFLRKAGRIHI